jgi:hypothetical protein
MSKSMMYSLNNIYICFIWEEIYIIAHETMKELWCNTATTRHELWQQQELKAGR